VPFDHARDICHEVLDPTAILDIGDLSLIFEAMQHSFRPASSSIAHARRAPQRYVELRIVGRGLLNLMNQRYKWDGTYLPVCHRVRVDLGR
jgi:hypothetical protein